jgi:hypothetical protein
MAYPLPILYLWLPFLSPVETCSQHLCGFVKMAVPGSIVAQERHVAEKRGFFLASHVGFDPLPELGHSSQLLCSCLHGVVFCYTATRYTVSHYLAVSLTRHEHALKPSRVASPVGSWSHHRSAFAVCREMLHGLARMAHAVM